MLCVPLQVLADVLVELTDAKLQSDTSLSIVIAVLTDLTDPRESIVLPNLPLPPPLELELIDVLELTVSRLTAICLFIGMPEVVLEVLPFRSILG